MTPKAESSDVQA